MRPCVTTRQLRRWLSFDFACDGFSGHVVSCPRCLERLRSLEAAIAQANALREWSDLDPPTPKDRIRLAEMRAPVISRRRAVVDLLSGPPSGWAAAAPTLPLSADIVEELAAALLLVVDRHPTESAQLAVSLLQAMLCLPAQDRDRPHALILLVLAGCTSARGQHTSALRLLDDAQELLAEPLVAFELSDILVARGKVLAALGRRRAARRAFTLAGIQLRRLFRSDAEPRALRAALRRRRRTRP